MNQNEVEAIAGALFENPPPTPGRARAFTWDELPEEFRAPWIEKARYAILADPLRLRLGPAAVDAIMAGEAAVVQIAEAKPESGNYVRPDGSANLVVVGNYGDRAFNLRLPRLDTPEKEPG